MILEKFIQIAHADDVTITNPIGDTKDIPGVILKVTSFLLTIAGSLAILAVIVGGIYYITSLGDEKKVTQAKSILTYSIWGLILIILAYTVIQTINSAF